jgi:hypothetical protein
MRDNTAIKHIARCTKEGLKKFARKVWSTKKGRIGTYVLGAVVLCWIAMYIWVPRTLFPDPYSTLIYSRSGELMGARIADDGQWRFPMPDTLPQKFVTCLTTYEDKRFFWHPGVDILATARAARQNLSSGKIVSGGSTITMQLARIARKGKERTFGEKAIEMAWAVFLETKYSKKKILNLYASHAPFGGNVVGLETAAWRYFGRPAADLSWAEMATLTVLPNSPALIHPRRNRQKLLEKRNGLLTKLRDKGVLNNMEYGLACMEPLPAAPVPLPNNAPHLLATLAKERQGERIATSINASLQRQTQEIVDHYAQEYASNHVYNLSALIADTETGEVLAYAGNVSFPLDVSLGGQVDLIQAPRSTGSVLKPFLYAAMLNDGLILPSTLIADTPLNINGYSPQNFTKSYSGAVPANVAIERSLNVPLVRMLSSYNTGRFLTLLKSLGMTTLSYSEEHYGSSLILGGAEGTMWDMAGMYASLARTLKHYSQYNGRYNPQDIHRSDTLCDAERRAALHVDDGRQADGQAPALGSIDMVHLRSHVGSEPPRGRIGMAAVREHEKSGVEDGHELRRKGCVGHWRHAPLCGGRMGRQCVGRRTGGTDGRRLCCPRAVRPVLPPPLEQLVRRAVRRDGEGGDMPKERIQGIAALRGGHGICAAVGEEDARLSLPQARAPHPRRTLSGEQLVRASEQYQDLFVVRAAACTGILLPKQPRRLSHTSALQARLRACLRATDRHYLSRTRQCALPAQRTVGTAGEVRLQSCRRASRREGLLACGQSLSGHDGDEPPDGMRGEAGKAYPRPRRRPGQPAKDYVRGPKGTDGQGECAMTMPPPDDTL